MTPEQENAVETVTREVAAYGDQLIPGAAEQIGRLWGVGAIGKMGPVQRAEAIAKGMGSPLVDRFRNPAYDPASNTDPVREAIGHHSLQLREGAADELATAWRGELAGRNPVALAGEVARRINAPANAGYLKNPPPEPLYAGRLRALLTANFGDVMTPNGITGLIGDRGRQYQGMPDHQVILQVAAVMKYPGFAEQYGTGRTIEAGDRRLSGGGTHTTPAREPVKLPIQPATPNREAASGRFATAETAAPPRRLPSF